MGRLNRDTVVKRDTVVNSRRLDPTQTGLESEKLLRDLRRMVVGQGEAIEEIATVYQTYLAGMTSPGRPIGNFLFLGPTGTGKTRVVEAVAESLVGDVRAVLRVDCAEFRHAHEVAKLIGSPPGYLGHRETHPRLSQEILNQYHTEKVKVSFVLFDEIEKAGDGLWNLLLGVLDKATLTLGDNRRVSFERAMIFMTSNLGAAEMGNILRPKMGFAAGAVDVGGEELDGKVERVGVQAARRRFLPEFMNRIDKVVVFKALGRVEFERILTIELGVVQQRVFTSASTDPFVFNVTEGGRAFLLEEGTDVRYGARHLKRAIQRLLLQPMSNLIASGQVRGGDLVRVDVDWEGRRLVFIKEGEGIGASDMAGMLEEAPEAVMAAGAGTVEKTEKGSRAVVARSEKRD